ncbi:hypothetical protein [Rufibacter latericius]|uniref:STAS/SEC14 domain-containing protein n=1 Tax=Rufibacter latericius TaxID=2487040 RepID=A0A3M9MYN5_9BACT|nr:hypothetical protein [Rufibacter latericius]RNI30662.1 hypothetical protein EFB08_05285 [Rufibacter latericius]
MDKQLPLESQPEPVFQTEFVAIHLHKDRSLLLVEWLRQINLEERKIGFLEALKITTQHQLQNWLIDDLQIYIITPEEKNWVLTEFQDLASKTTIQKLAVVTPDFYPALVSNTEFTDKGKQGYKAKGVIQHEVFIDYASALDWLMLPA